MDIELISVMADPMPELAAETKRFAITTPVASDRDNKTCRAYGIGRNCASMGGKPGHVFVMVGKDGLIKWVRDYDMLMYVPVHQVYQDLARVWQG